MRADTYRHKFVSICLYYVLCYAQNPTLPLGYPAFFNGQRRVEIAVQAAAGSAKDNTDDVLVTTKDQTKVGDVVVAKGIVHTDKDLGSGYSYKVPVEEATLQK